MRHYTWIKQRGGKGAKTKQGSEKGPPKVNLITIAPKTANQLITRDPNFTWNWFIGLPNVFSPNKIKIITKLMCMFIFKKSKIDWHWDGANEWV